MNNTILQFKNILSNKVNSPTKSILFMLIFLLIDVFILMSFKDIKSQNRTSDDKNTNDIQHGQYLVKLAGCNDCHTAGYGEKNGDIPESKWLTGSPIGFKGPWGTTYPSNLRLFVQNVNEEGWLVMARKRNTMPPMPWPSLHAMNDNDLLAIYHYIKSLGIAGKKTPSFVPPNEEPKTPYIIFEPQHMERLTEMKD